MARDRATFERDQDKDVEAMVNGLVSIRVTDERLEQAAEGEAVRLSAILEARRRGPA
jgi:hypothetical protein